LKAADHSRLRPVARTPFEELKQNFESNDDAVGLFGLVEVFVSA
jgi:hypothetical protein